MESTADGAGPDALAELSNLVDPVRRRLYEYVAAQREPVSREEAAGATGITRTLAAYHLDKLSDAGLMDTSYSRPPGRPGGPGAGRPAKRYVRADRELAVSVPARTYLLMADLLATAIETDTTGSVHAAASRLARQVGRDAIAQTGTDLDAALHGCGYEPASTEAGDIELRNCPFHQLSTSHTNLVCSLNLDLINGLLEGVGHANDWAELAPQEGRCCVVIHPSATR